MTCLSVDRCFGELYHCKPQCDDVVQTLGVSDMLSVDRCFGELYHCKTQCNDVVQRLGAGDMFICGPLFR